jgi:GH24 family phage-related lysozyme (muramidase)
MTVVDRKKLKARIEGEEGRKYKAYVDSLGVLTIGIGRNIKDKGLNDQEIDLMFNNDIDDVEKDLREKLPWVFNLDEVRLSVFYDLCFNLGINRLLEFSHMLAFAEAGDYNTAADELHHSLWDSQVGHRAVVLETMLRTGVEP